MLTLVVYRNSRRPKVDTDTLRRYDETGAGEAVQLGADRKWYPIAPVRRPRVKAIVYVGDGTVARVRAVDPDPSRWKTDDRGYVDVPVGPPLTDLQIGPTVPHPGPHPRHPTPAHARQDP